MLGSSDQCRKIVSKVTGIRLKAGGLLSRQARVNCNVRKWLETCQFVQREILTKAAIQVG